MDNNPTPTPAPEPQPAPAPEPPTSPAPEPTPEPAPAPEPVSVPEPAAEPAPAPELAPAPETPEPAPEPAPETPAPTPAPAPETTAPTPAPAPEAPAPIPDPAAEPAAPAFNPFDPAATTAPAGPIPAPKQGKKGKLIGIIVGAAVLVLAAAAVLFLHFTSTTPEKILSNAIINNLNASAVAFSATTEWQTTSSSTVNTETEDTETEDAEPETLSYSVDAYIPDSTTGYVRINGFGAIFGTLYSFLGGSLKSEFTNAFSEIDGVWWKVDANAQTENSSVMSLTGYTIDTEAVKKMLDAYKQNPFLVATKSTENKTYKTSGTAYVITVDKTKYEAFADALEKADANSRSLSLGPLTLNDDAFEDAKIVMTIQSSFFGGGTLTGVYSESTGDTTSYQKTSVDFEHVLTSAPADAKDVSELVSELQKINGGGSSSETTGAAQRDTQRRNDYAALSTNVISYMTNNNGNLPPVGTLDATAFLNATGTDPSGYPYALSVVDYAEEYEMSWGVNAGESTNVYVVLHATCDADYKLATSEGARDFAIAGSLESDSYYCQSSN